MFRNKKVIDFLLLFLVLLLGLWQLFFFKGAMKWDATDIYLPWKYFITECVSNGVLPLWNPFVNSGFSQMGDSSTWYPISWIIGLLMRYNLSAVHLEYIFHLFIAGVGFYKLSESFSFSRQTRIILAISYMFSGVFISNAQHIGWIVSASWLPFVLLYYNQLKFSQSLNNLLKLSLVMFLMLSGGYLGVFISTVYILIAYSFYIGWNLIREKKYEELKKWTYYLVFSAVVFILLSLVVIVAAFDLSEHITRGAGLSFDNESWGALNGSLPFRALLTFLFPYSATINTSSFWSEDLSMLNCYIGVFPMFVAFMAIFQKKYKSLSIRGFLISIFFLMVAIAQVFPFREWMMVLPFMELFRFPALFRIFSIFGFLLVAGYGFETIFNSDKNKFTLRYFSFVFLFLIALNVFIFFKIDVWHFKLLLEKGFLEFNKLAGIKERIFYQGIITSFIVLSALLLFKSNKKKYIKWGIVFLCGLDLTIAVQLNGYTTVFSEESSRLTDLVLKDLPEDYPKPSLTTKMSEVNQNVLKIAPAKLYKNAATYYKMPSSDGSSPYFYNNSKIALENKTYEAVINNPFLFLAGKISKNGIVAVKTIDNSSYKKINILDFTPNRIEVMINVDYASNIVMLQNYYPYWTATINNSPQAIIKTNDTFMSIPIQKGESRIVFEFRPQKVKYAFYLSVSLFVLVIITLIMFYLKEGDKKNKTIVFLFLLITFLTIVIYRISNRENNDAVYSEINELIEENINKYSDSVSIIMDVDNPLEIEPRSQLSMLEVNNENEIQDFISLLEKNNSEYVLFGQINKKSLIDVKYLFNEDYIAVYEKEKVGKSSWHSLYKKRMNNKNENILSFNDFESSSIEWSNTPKRIDSTKSFSGNNSFKLDSSFIYSSGLKKKITDFVTVADEKLIISVAFTSEKDANPILVFEIKRGGEKLKWIGEKMSSWYRKDVWSQVFLEVELNDLELEKDDVFSVYVWNNSKKQVWIDDFKIEKY